MAVLLLSVNPIETTYWGLQHEIDWILAVKFQFHDCLHTLHVTIELRSRPQNYLRVDVEAFSEQADKILLIAVTSF